MTAFIGLFLLSMILLIGMVIYALAFPITWAILAVVGMVWLIYVGIISWFIAVLVLGIIGCLIKAVIEHDKPVQWK
jgi:hypothetical protein